jgi:transcriptional regulator with XRE-family HTH domain
MCPHCKAPQPFIAQLSPNGYCARCKKWLGKAVRESGLDQFSVLPPESSDWEIWVARGVAETIERSFASPARLKKDTLSKIIRAGVAAEGFSGFARLLGVSTAAIQSWRLGQSSPMLPVYARLARVFHLSLPDLLTNRVRSRLVVDPSDVPYWRAIRIATPAVFDPGKAKHHLEKALRESPPPSFGVFRTSHRYHDSTLKNHFPKLCAQLVRRNHDYRTAASAKRLADRLSEFRSIAYRFHEQGRELVLNHIMKQLSVPKGLEHKVGRHLLAKVKAEIKARETKRKKSTLIAGAM